jgi:hypothetical protein
VRIEIFNGVNSLNKNDKFALFNYLVLYNSILIGLTHKYAHEQNHNRYVPPVIKILQDLGLSISGKEHKIHHGKLNCNFSLFNGFANNHANKFINLIDKIFNTEHYEAMIELSKEYKKKYGNDITIKFVGDIEGEIIVNLKKNVFSRKK